MTIQLLHRKNYKKIPWKNGMGFTYEIAIYPQQASVSENNFLWRISTALIEKNSEFSLFPEHDRKLIILNDSVRLKQSDSFFELSENKVFSFPGNLKTSCELVNGPVHDLNIFTHKTQTRCKVEIVSINPGQAFIWTTAGQWNFAYLSIGSLSANEQMNVGDTLQVDSGKTIKFESQLKSQLILIEIQLQSE